MEKKDLKSLTIPTMEKIRASLAEKNTSKAIENIKALIEETKKTNDLVANWIWLLLTFIANNYGEEKVFEALTYKNKLLHPLCEEMVNAPVEEKIRFLASLMHAQFSNVVIQEDEAKFTMKLNPCGMSGRMRREGLDREPTNLRNTSRAYEWSWEKKGMAYCCAQCYLMAKVIEGPQSKRQKMVIDCPTTPDEPCQWHLYKTKVGNSN